MKKCGYCARKHPDSALVCECGAFNPFGSKSIYANLLNPTPTRVLTASSEYVEGYDVSFWQDLNSTPQKINFEKMRSTGRVFCGIRASQATHADSDFGDNYRNARGVISRFAYHYLDWTKPFIDQVDFFWSLIRDDIGESGPELDFEEWENAPPPGTARQQYRDACGRLQYLLQSVGWDTVNHKQKTYSAPGYWATFGSPDPWWMLNTDLHLAHYYVPAPDVPRPWYIYDIWQYGVKGDGIAAGCESLQIDCNRLHPSIPFSAWSLPLPGAPEPPPPSEEIMQKYQVVSASGLNLRDAPNTSSTVKAVWPYLGTLTGTGDTHSNGIDAWVQVQHATLGPLWAAWIYSSKKYLQPIG